MCGSILTKAEKIVAVASLMVASVQAQLIDNTQTASTARAGIKLTVLFNDPSDPE